MKNIEKTDPKLLSIFNNFEEILKKNKDIDQHEFEDAVKSYLSKSILEHPFLNAESIIRVTKNRCVELVDYLEAKYPANNGYSIIKIRIALGYYEKLQAYEECDAEFKLNALRDLIGSSSSKTKEQKEKLILCVSEMARQHSSDYKLIYQCLRESGRLNKDAIKLLQRIFSDEIGNAIIHGDTEFLSNDILIVDGGYTYKFIGHVVEHISRKYVSDRSKGEILSRIIKITDSAIPTISILSSIECDIKDHIKANRLSYVEDAISKHKWFVRWLEKTTDYEVEKLLETCNYRSFIEVGILAMCLGKKEHKEAALKYFGRSYYPGNEQSESKLSTERWLIQLTCNTIENYPPDSKYINDFAERFSVILGVSRSLGLGSAPVEGGLEMYARKNNGLKMSIKIIKDFNIEIKGPYLKSKIFADDLSI